MLSQTYSYWTLICYVLYKTVNSHSLANKHYIMHIFLHKLINQYFNCQTRLQPITLTQLRTRHIYWFLLYIRNEMADNKPECISKWNALFPNETLKWDKMFFLPYKIYKNTRFQFLQYRLLHRTLYTRIIQIAKLVTVTFI